jgi:hypothetical protein
MADRPGDATPLWRILLIPSAITLAVTLLRLWGELRGWPSLLFSTAPGGGAAIVGITWLVPVFGVTFAWRLAPRERDLSPLRVLGGSTLALVVVLGLPLLVGLVKKDQGALGLLGVFAVASILGTLGSLAAWPALGRTLLAYGLAARVPVAIIMYLAMSGGWQTHYDMAPPGFTGMKVAARWFWLGLLPQMTIWLAYTVIVGTMAGAIALVMVEVRGLQRSPGGIRPAAPRPAANAGASPGVSAPGSRPTVPPSLVRPAPPRGPRRP